MFSDQLVYIDNTCDNTGISTEIFLSESLVVLATVVLVNTDV